MDTGDIVRSLVEAHHTRNPFLIANYEGITVLYREYVQTLGYYIPGHIVLDRNLHRICQTVVCSHELGHAVLHPHTLSYFPMGRVITDMEWAATDFARLLLYPDDPHMTTEHMIEYMEFLIRQPWK